VIISALGWVAALLAASAALPQVVRLLRTRSTAGISVVAWRLTLAANLGWTMHGLSTGHVNIVIPNLVFGTFSTLILVMLGRARSLPLLPLLVPSVLVAVTTFGLDLWLGPVAFAIAAGLPSLVAQLMQFHELVVAPRITGVSIPFLTLNVVNQLCWFSWAVLTGEQSVILCASVLGSLMAANLVWATLRRSGLVRARLAVIWA
jgi:uncharacterized protein with PQ loop repeat